LTQGCISLVNDAYAQCSAECGADFECLQNCASQREENLTKCPCNSGCRGDCPCPEFDCDQGYQMYKFYFTFYNKYIHFYCIIMFIFASLSVTFWFRKSRKDVKIRNPIPMSFRVTKKLIKNLKNVLKCVLRIQHVFTNVQVNVQCF